jgi:hypothetical protein
MTEEDAACLAISRLWSLVPDNESISSIGYRYERPLVITIYVVGDTHGVPDQFPRTVVISDDRQRFSFTTEVVPGGRIVPLIAPFSIKPRDVDAPFPLKGGLPCSFPGASGWGTAGAFVTELDIEVPNGPYNCTAIYCVLSNNHVIADSDQRGQGAPVTIGFYGQDPWATAYLHCWIPVHDERIQMDFAAAQNLTPRNYSGGYLIGIGEPNWNNFSFGRRCDLI